MSAPVGDLGGPLLRSVSRSFFLTIRILPTALRGPIGLAYLLARASDTIADTAEAPGAVRLGHLAAFEEMIVRGTIENLPALQRDIRPPDQSERDLIARLGECLAWFATMDDIARTEIRAVMGKIIRGQTLDLQRFPARPDGVTVALQTAEELEEYTYLVAGSVGEFWTRLCVQRLPRYSPLDLETLCRIGINFGKGLQLVNILRDLPADLRMGRCYLPEAELRADGATPGMLLTSPSTARPTFTRWHARAATWLDDGRRYIAAICPARLRAGCFLPWYLGVKTLDLLAAHSPLETPKRLKVPRSAVHAALLRALVVTFSDVPVRSAAHNL